MRIDDLLAGKGLEPVRAQFVAPTPAELSEVRSIIGHDLLPPYAEFVARYGRSRFSRLATVRAATGARKFPFSLFYGGGDKPGQNLLMAIRRFRGRMPADVIPIAADEFGNQFCMKVGGKDSGRIYFWDHEDEQDPSDFTDAGEAPPADLMYRNMVPVADSFEALIEQIQLRG